VRTGFNAGTAANTGVVVYGYMVAASIIAEFDGACLYAPVAIDAFVFKNPDNLRQSPEGGISEFFGGIFRKPVPVLIVHCRPLPISLCIHL
jgi:hypothetical protein